MFNTVMEYLKLGFNITKENPTLGLYKFLISFGVGLISFLLIALDVTAVVLFFQDLDFEYFIRNLPELVELIDSTQIIIGVFLIIFDLIVFTLLFLLLHFKIKGGPIISGFNSSPCALINFPSFQEITLNILPSILLSIKNISINNL